MNTILLIEGSGNSAKEISSLFLNANYNLIRVVKIEDGIREVKLKKPSLILVDFDRFKEESLEFARLLKQDPLIRDTTLVSLMAEEKSESLDKIVGVGFSGYIVKKFDESFIQKIDNYLNKVQYKSEVNKGNQSLQLPAEDQDHIDKSNKWHNVLIVDDNAINVDLLKEILEQIGKSSKAAYNAKRAFEMLEKEHFDLILLDIMMPEMNGFEAIKHLKKNPKTSKIPVLFVSALNETTDIVKGLDLGSYGYITKPYNIEEVKARIINTLRIKDVQQELETEKNKLDLIFKFSADAILMLNTSFEIVSFNKKFREFFDIDFKSVCGQKVFSVIPTDVNFNEDLIIESLKVKKSIKKEVAVDSEKCSKYYDINCSKINPSQDVAEGYVFVIRDITDSKEIEKQKETFVATLTHDLKTPIRAEMRALELLLKGSFGSLNEDQVSILKDTLYSSKYMFKMIENLLATYKYEHGKISLKKEKADILNLIKNICVELKYLLSDKNQELSLNFENESIFLEVDVLEITRVIMNLLTNSINYTQDGGNIVVTVKRYPNNILLSFEDNGRGIAAGEMTYLFDKYKSYAKKFRQVGTGLGLYLSKQIVELHDGEIWAESTEGQGSTFNVRLPIY